MRPAPTNTITRLKPAYFWCHWKKFILFVILAPLFGISSCNGQLWVEHIGYWESLDSTQIAEFCNLSTEFRTHYKYGGYKKTNEIFPYGEFMGMKINFVPPPANFSALYVSKEGSIYSTTKSLVDSLFMEAFVNAAFKVENEEVFLYYMLLTRSGYLVRESSDLLNFQQDNKDQFDTYLKAQQTNAIDSRNKQTVIKYSYNRAYRTIFEYRFFVDSLGNWMRPPEKIALFTEVGPLNYWR